MPLTYIKISKKALLNNIAQIKKILPKKTKFMAVVKANAYGHGLFEVVNSVKNNVDYFAVFAFTDAVLMRKKGIKKPILVLGRILKEQVDEAIKHDLEVTVSTLDILQQVKKPLKAHICVDTGLGRDGFVFTDLKKVIEASKNSKVKIVGLYAHLAASDDSKENSYTEKQITELLTWKKAFNEIGLKPLVHHSASAGNIFGKIKEKFTKEFDIARIGVSLYGMWPSNEVKKSRQKIVKLQPVLTWIAKITELRHLPKGSKISYNCTYTLQRDSKIATLPIGYFDGISRLSSNKALAIVGGKKVPQIGRVTMNLIVLDVTDVKNVKIGDEVIIIGKKGNLEISADDLGAWGQTSCYESLTRINANILRKVV